ncbi:DUF3826 domain-containing protein [Filimonas effusa]|uniref:DUF3826 domain-containing protein n=1 Tax=Filimonas effusa TaxID=2508721 RepID=A0A4V1MAQ7_9BACT|nr:DUF3826 domain-containing protein [Filimonas effusa]RXK86716.1 DUF3826 domain-containing protein [Filimonas effusa]
MKIAKKICLAALITAATTINGYTQEGAKPAPAAQVTADAELETKATEWITSLQLDDAVKEARLKQVVFTHLKAVREWNNTHPSSTVPAGINPETGKPLSDLDRQIIANSAKPKSVHDDLMTGLRKDLTEEQVKLVLDKYTIGKVAFTLKGYKAIIPDLTAEEEKVILANLEQAREQAIDFKSMKQISAIFEIYKTKCEQYLNTHGRDWRALFKAYVDKVKASKAAEKKLKEKQ